MARLPGYAARRSTGAAAVAAMAVHSAPSSGPAEPQHAWIRGCIAHAEKYRADLARRVANEEAPQRVAFAFAYHGPAFQGYARQAEANLRTVEGELLKRLAVTGVLRDPARGRFKTGSRTDRGVSALMNVVAFDSAVPPDRVAPAVGTGITGLYPIEARPVSATFDPRRAIGREYRYFVDPAAYPDATPSDLETIMRIFVGTHDFTAFCKMEDGRPPQRSIQRIDVVADGPLWAVRIEGRDFLWHMIRRMMSAATRVLAGRERLETIERALRSPHRAPDLGLAPADPLFLWRVRYADLKFRMEEPLAGRTAVRWRTGWRWATTTARFYDALAERHG